VSGIGFTRYIAYFSAVDERHHTRLQRQQKLVAPAQGALLSADTVERKVGLLLQSSDSQRTAFVIPWS
jgi:hypothetical protein